MLRKRSRAVTSKQAIVVDHNNNLPWVPPDNNNNTKPTKPNNTSFFFNSPKIFKGLFTFCASSSCDESEPIMSPTSILDTKPFTALANSFWVDKKITIPTIPTTPRTSNTHSWEQPSNTKGIGVALVDENPEPNNPSSKQQQKRKLVLRIQVPPSSVFPCFSPESPREFGIKTPRTNLKPLGNWNCQVHPEKLGGNNGEGLEQEDISMIDMEQSEDYTCVISHGPNPKTTHIFGNCIVESCCGIDRSSSFSSRRNGYLSPLGNSVHSHESFLSFCHHCKKKLGEGDDIYMYRGEKAFCSQECRCQEMLFDGGES